MFVWGIYFYIMVVDDSVLNSWVILYGMRYFMVDGSMRVMFHNCAVCLL